ERGAPGLAPTRARVARACTAANEEGREYHDPARAAQHEEDRVVAPQPARDAHEALQAHETPLDGLAAHVDLAAFVRREDVEPEQARHGDEECCDRERR